MRRVQQSGGDAFGSLEGNRRDYRPVARGEARGEIGENAGVRVGQGLTGALALKVRQVAFY